MMVERPFLIRLALRLAQIAALTLSHLLCAQDLAPRAYLITPLHSNAITLTNSFYNGSLLFNGAVPITGATGTYGVSVISYYHSLSFFDRSANLTASLPYAVGTFQGEVIGEHQQIYRSGLVDSSFRFSVNLKGGPAISAQEFVKWKQKALLGVSLKVVAPTGQYSSTKLINWGSNRWSLKPEFGYSRRWGHYVLDAYTGVWLYTKNPDYYSIPRPQPQTVEPVGSFEGHVSYDVRQRLWFSIDGNFWFGGISSLSGIQNIKTEQTSSRIGGTLSFPLNKHQSIKVSYSNGDYDRFGGNYQNVSVAWQYSWLGKPK